MTPFLATFTAIQFLAVNRGIRGFSSKVLSTSSLIIRRSLFPQWGHTQRAPPSATAGAATELPLSVGLPSGPRP